MDTYKSNIDELFQKHEELSHIKNEQVAENTGL